MVVGSNSILSVSGKLMVHSTGVDTPKRSVIGSGAEVTVGGDMELTAEGLAKIAAKATVNVGGKLNMDAGTGTKCAVASSATVTFATKSGNCAPELP